MVWPFIAAGVLLSCAGWRQLERLRRFSTYTVRPLPTQLSSIAPVRFVELAPGHYFADFGKASFAALELTLPKTEAGRSLTIHLGETLSAPQRVERNPRRGIRAHTAQMKIKGGGRSSLAPLPGIDARRVPRHLRVQRVMPFRYVELQDAPGGLKPENLRQLMAHYPFDDSAADFACSNPKLNAVWELCKHTLKATSFAGLFLDGDRERKPYEADAYINQLGWYYCCGEGALPRYSHEYLLRHPTWPTEWILFSVLMAWEDYFYSGETASLRVFYEDLKAKTLLALARPDGLITTPRRLPRAVARSIYATRIRDIVDWPVEYRDNYDMLPVNTVVNAFHAHALRRMADIAAALGNTGDERGFRAASARAASSLNTKLVDPESGLYVDGEGSRHQSLHANMFPLAFGLVPEPRRERVAEFVASRGMACSVYGAQFLLDALFDSRRAEKALALMTAPERSWTSMIEQTGTTMTLENWDVQRSGWDWNHAWATAPANVLPRKLMGVAPLEPGFTKVLVRPQPGGLAWAESRTPTPFGAVTVRFEQSAEFHLSIEIPPRVRARVELPLAKAAAVKEGASAIQDGRKGAFNLDIDTGVLFVDNVPVGRHEYIVPWSVL